MTKRVAIDEAIRADFVFVPLTDTDASMLMRLPLADAIAQARERGQHLVAEHRDEHVEVMMARFVGKSRP